MLWVAQGFGVGRIPWAPGTWGSLLGLLWLAALLALQNLWLAGLSYLTSVVLSVWLCGQAETLLHQHDPPSVVLDEIVAIPLCFLGWLCLWSHRTGYWPQAHQLLSSGIWPWTLGITVGFRFFDILKPWPVRQSQALPGGWGVTIDDLLAAVYVNLVVVLFTLVMPTLPLQGWMLALGKPE